jgi:hypothetical protein
MYNELRPPLREEPDELGSLSREIARAVSSHGPKLEQLVGLEEPNSQFRDDLSEAILLCVLTHKFPPKRRSETRKQLESLRQEAAAAALRPTSSECAVKGLPAQKHLRQAPRGDSELREVRKRSTKELLNCG